MDEVIKSKCQKLIVVVIDFGIIFFGYVFFFWDNWVKVLINNWQGGFLFFYKVFIVFLLNSKVEFVVFGFDVEDKYVIMIEGGVYRDYYFFLRFKMILY